MVPLSGTVTVAMNANGDQVAYNGHLLYRFAGDKAKGDAKGKGLQAFGGVWQVATPSLAAVGKTALTSRSRQAHAGLPQARGSRLDRRRRFHIEAKS